MNLRIVICIIITLVIALQSVGTVASASQTHQIDIEHLQTEHVHAEHIHAEHHDAKQYPTVTELYDQDGHNIKDCHHCGHCSGSHLSWYVSKLVNQLPIVLALNDYSQTHSHTIHRHEPQFKPPKA
ncbi:DUF2946 domain-containing protein [Pseudoalteromonas sp. T1lg23B]|uniref:DUF2946 domain-containing protein n=1 Tax=Pseudoalteromonas sp. T1lg23B TaxID=2077097 RepID=UPI001319F75C|nr:DUF2946 domain-containing protein [Pseudoalteromonas sp. T1lg23B]